MGVFLGYETPEYAPIPTPRPGGMGGLGGQPQQPQGSFLQGDNFGNVLQALGISLMSSPRNAPLSGFGEGLQVAQRGSLAQQERQQAQQARNSTKQWLLSRGLSEEDANAAIGNPTILSSLIKQIQGGDDSEESFFGNPITIEGPDGTLKIGQMGNKGTFRELNLGEGNKLASPTKTEDTGTEIITYDRFGNELFRTPKQNYQKAYEEGRGGAEGRAAGEDTATYQSIMSKMPGLEKVVTDLDSLADSATYTAAGQGLDWARGQMGMEPRDAAVARAQYIAIVDNQILPLLRDTFGAQFTQREGETLRATLGDANKTPKEKQAILRAFIEQKRRDVEALGVRTGAANTPAASGVAADPFGIR